MKDLLKNEFAQLYIYVYTYADFYHEKQLQPKKSLKLPMIYRSINVPVFQKVPYLNLDIAALLQLLI
jgi:hypothetical protein